MTSIEFETSAVRPGIGPRIGLWGRFDVASFGDLLVPHVFEHEMRRRLVGAAVQTYAPLGPRHPIALDGGLTAKPLGAWSRFRAAELARELDCVVIGGGDLIHTQDSLFADDYGLSTDEIHRLRLSSFFVEGLGPSLEKTCPVAWNAVGVPFAFRGEDAVRVRSALGAGRYLSVRDVASRKRLLDAGIQARVEVVPDPTLLVSRVFPSDLLGRRLEYLRFMDWFPRSGKPIILQGSRSLVPRARSIARALLRGLQKRTVPIVLLETQIGRGEDAFFEALYPHLSGALFRLPASAALSDIAAALAHSSLFAGTSSTAGLAAYSFGVPVARIDLLGGRRPTPWPASLERQAGPPITALQDLAAAIRRLLSTSRPDGLPRDVERRLDRHFDVLAEIAEKAVERRGSRGRRRSAAAAQVLRDAERRLESWRLAYDSRSEQLLHQRFRLSEALEKSESELTATRQEKAALESEIARAADATRSAQETLDQSYRREVEAQKTMHRLEKDLITSLAERAHAEQDLAVARAAAEAHAATAAELAVERAERVRVERELPELRERVSRLEDELSSERARRAQDEREMAARLEERNRELRARDEERLHAERAVEVLRSEVDRLRTALDRLQRNESRLRISRAQLLDEVKGGSSAARSEEVERLRTELARVRSDLQQLVNLKVFRYSAPLRAVYGRFLAVARRLKKSGA